MNKYLQYTIDDFLLDDNFRDWALGRSTAESARQWQELIKRHPEKKVELEEAVFLIKSFHSIHDEEVSTEQIHQLWNRINEPQSSRKLKIPVHYLKYAAVFVVALLIGALGYRFVEAYGWNQQVAYNELTIPYGERSEIALYDGTKVWLNSGTTMKFPTSFSPDERRIYLDGEAYFEVSHKSNHQPFIVSTPAMDIKVLGTHFNVNAYADDAEVVATLEEGKIVVVDKYSRQETELQPGDQLAVNITSGQAQLQSVDTELFTCWKDNLLRFQDATFDEVIQKMERWYDVNIKLQKGMQVKKLYTMTIKTESLREMLNLLTYTTAIKYEINEENVFIGRP